MTISRTTTVYNSHINPTLNRLVLENFCQLGEEVDETPYYMNGSSDFGNVSQVVPACMFMVQTHPAGTPWHSAEVARIAGEAGALQGMLAGAKALAGVAIDLLAEPALLAEAQEDFGQG